MRTKNTNKVYFIFITLAVLLLGSAGIHRLIIKPDIPFGYEDSSEGIRITSAGNQIPPGSLIKSVNNVNVESTFQLEFLIDSYSIGDTLYVFCKSENKDVSVKSSAVRVALKHYYTTPVFILISGITGFLFWLTAIFIYVRRTGEKLSVLLFHLFMVLSLAVLTSPGEYKANGDVTGMLVMSFHLSSYMLVFSCMIHLTFIFSENKKYKRIPFVIHTVTLLIGAVLSVFFMSAINSGFLIESVKLYELSWDITKIFMLVLTLASVIMLYINYRNCRHEKTKKNLLWVLKGLMFGGAPYLLLYVLPSLMDMEQTIPEEILLAFLILIPVLYYVEEGRDSKHIESMNLLKSQAVSSLSHELQTPLTAIRMHAETLLNGRIIDETRKDEYMKVILGESERLSRMIQNLLDVSRIEKGIKNYYFNRIDVKEAVNHTLELLDYEFRKNEFTVVTELPDEFVLIYADRDAVVQVLVNLLINAMKYSQDCKEISLKLETTASEAVISVQDKGIGIKSNEIENIFDLYYRTLSGREKDATGTGIGLSLVSHIVKAHGGKIEVESEPGKGSIFIITFKFFENENNSYN